MYRFTVFIDTIIGIPKNTEISIWYVSMTSLEKTLAIREKRHDFDPSYVYIDLYIILNYIHKHEYVTGNKMWTYTNKAAMIAAVATNP